jgi:hypothetical protein
LLQSCSEILRHLKRDKKGALFPEKKQYAVMAGSAATKPSRAAHEGWMASLRSQ